MEHNRAKNQNQELSKLGLGTWVFGSDSWGKISEQECIDVVIAAIDGGVNFIDTAPVYGFGAAEKILGKALKGKRDKVILATKCGIVSNGNRIGNNLSAASIIREIESSLLRLQTEYIDLYQCHWPDRNTPIAETMDTLLKLKADGKIRNIGVSNFGLDLLKDACRCGEIFSSQNQYSILERSLEQGVLPFCKDANISVLTYGSLGGGILSGKYNAIPVFPKSDARSFFYPYYRKTEFEKVQNVLRAVGKINKPLNQIALNWVRQQKGVTSVLVGCRTIAQLNQNLKSLAWELTPEELEYITEKLNETSAEKLPHG